MTNEHAFAPIVLKNLNRPWEQAISRASKYSLPARKTIVSNAKGTEYDGLYYIVNGRVRLSYIAANGSEKVLFYIGNGTLFNEIPMLVYTNTAIFTTVIPTTVYFWQRKHMNKIFLAYPTLVNNLLESLSHKASNFYSQLCSLGLFNTFTNVCRALYSMHLHNREGGIIIPLLTQQELATFMGIHRSSLHNALFRLKEENIIIKYTKNELVIANIEALYQYASEVDEGQV